jgi:hypothetical protein
MRHLRRTLLAAVAVALCAAPVAGAHDPHKNRGDAVVAPAKDKWLGELYAQLYSLPLSENPLAGNGNPCLRVGHNVFQAINGPCTIEQGAAFTLGIGTSWSSAEDPFPMTRAKQLSLALAADRENVVGMTVTVDPPGDPVEIRTRRFELFSPQRTLLLPADNILGLDGPKIVTLSAHGWGAVVRKLSVGEHTIVSDVLSANGVHDIVPHIITVVRRHGHHGAG